MGRPRGSSNPMHPSRLLKTASSSNMNLMNLHLPALPATSIPRSLEEDLESQARAAISLFGFGSVEGVTWSRVQNAGDVASAMTSLVLMERVCPLGTNAFLWGTMQNGETILTASGSGDASDMENVHVQPEDADDWTAVSASAAAADSTPFQHLFSSKVLQQYLVKGTAVIPATLEEVIELLVHSDSDDMELAMQHLVGVKTHASGMIYRRRKKRLRRRHMPAGVGHAALGHGRTLGPKSLSSTALTYESDSSSEGSSGDEGELARLSCLPNGNGNGMPTTRRTTTAARRRSIVNTNRLTSIATPSMLGTADLSDPQGLLAETGNRGNLSIKWVVGEKPGRMFASRVNYCLVDYECIIVNDWDEHDGGAMYVRSMQSCYLPQCQPWLDEFGVRPTDLQPTGFMVREARHREGYVEVQFVASILEKAQLPNASRRNKLRALVGKIARLEEIVTSRRLSQSLLSHQPMWVHNRDRALCSSCEAKFGLSRRRHHCRLCGDICCSECCPKVDVALPDVGVTSVRVCVICVRKRRQSSADVGNASMSSSNASYMSSPLVTTGSSRKGLGLTTSTPPPPPPPLAPHTPPLPPFGSSSSSSSDYLSSSHGSLSNGSLGMGERKPSILQRLKGNN